MSSLAGWFIPDLLSWSVFWIVAAYMAVDASCAALVLRNPAGLAQRIVGLGYAGMLLFHCGFILSDKGNWDAYAEAQGFVGWMQIAALFGWGAYDLGMAVVRRWPSHSQADSAARV